MKSQEMKLKYKKVNSYLRVVKIDDKEIYIGKEESNVVSGRYWYFVEINNKVLTHGYNLSSAKQFVIKYLQGN